jgi:hypothetical protein
MKIVKVFSLSLLVLALSIGSAQAQFKGDKAVGANLALGLSDGDARIGLGAKFLYNIIDPVRVEAAFTYFLKSDYVSMIDISAYGHYLFPINDKFTAYPLTGVGYCNARASYGGVSHSEGKFVYTLGGGADYRLSSNLILQGDLKYKFVGSSYIFMISAGVAFQF